MSRDESECYITKFVDQCYYAPPLIGGALYKRWRCLTPDICLSVAYIGPNDVGYLCVNFSLPSALCSRLRRPKSRTESIGRLKLAQRSPTSHMTRTPLKRSRSPGRSTHRGVNASASCSGGRGNILTVGTYCYVVVCSTLHTRSAWRVNTAVIGLQWWPWPFGLESGVRVTCDVGSLCQF